MMGLSIRTKARHSGVDRDTGNRGASDSLVIGRECARPSSSVAILYVPEKLGFR